MSDTSVPPSGEFLNAGASIEFCKGMLRALSPINILRAAGTIAHYTIATDFTINSIMLISEKCGWGLYDRVLNVSPLSEYNNSLLLNRFTLAISGAYMAARTLNELMRSDAETPASPQSSLLRPYIAMAATVGIMFCNIATIQKPRSDDIHSNVSIAWHTSKDVTDGGSMVAINPKRPNENTAALTEVRLTEPSKAPELVP